MKKLKRTPEQIANLFKTWDKQTLVESRDKFYRMLNDYASEPISQRTPNQNKFYKRIANDLEYIKKELQTR
jgi:hypothetical protein